MAKNKKMDKDDVEKFNELGEERWELDSVIRKHWEDMAKVVLEKIKSYK